MVKPGYKETEIGVIPEEWSLMTIKDIGLLTSGVSPTGLSDGKIPFYKVEQLNNSNKYQTETPYHVKVDKPISAGSIIFPKRGAAIFTNKIRILSQDSFVDTNIMALTISNIDICPEYVYYILSRKGLGEIADTTSVPQINNKHIYPLLIPKPPISEQNHIAEALSDVDNMISSLEKLIEKKKAIKQGMMEQLLTGKVRLPGFSGEWITKKLVDCTERIIVGLATSVTQYYREQGVVIFRNLNILPNHLDDSDVLFLAPTLIQVSKVPPSSCRNLRFVI